MTTTQADPRAADQWGHGPGAIVTIGHGGWGIHFRTVPGSHVSSSTLSGYGDDWREKLADLEPGALVVDLTAIPLRELTDLTIKGPMLDPKVPPGEIRSFGRGTCAIDRGARFYGARSLDYISPEDYADLAAEHGANVYPAADAA